MSVTGIIAEFNPLHTGHEFLIKEAEKNGAVVCVLSGNFVQRGDVAVIEKRKRAKAALLSGADLVVELPVLWAMSTAQNFSLGGVSILSNIGCDKIMFGSESGDIAALNTAAQAISSPLFREYLQKELKKGITFAKARQNAAEKLGVNPEVLEGANNNLAVEYMLAAKENSFNIAFDTVKRVGADHDSFNEDEYVSATLLRKKLQSGDFTFCKKYMPDAMLNEICEDDIADISRIENAILATLRTKTIDELKILPDISEGLENKLLDAIRVATSLEELYNEIKVKRYTMARIRRIVLSAFLGLDNSFFMCEPPYIRVLGFNKRGEEILKTAAKHSKIPIVTKVSDIAELQNSAKKVFEAETKATDLFALALKKPKVCKAEYTAKIIKTE